MNPRHCLLAFAVCSFSCAYAANGSHAIGTINAPGDLRVDGFSVPGNSTLFDGTSIQTGSASATLRLGTGTDITMASDSQGVVHRDRLVLLEGRSQLTATNAPFYLEAEGLRVKPGSPDAVGVVSVGAANNVEIAALKGEFLVLDSAGLPLLHVAPGTTMALHQATSAATNGNSITEVGMVSESKGVYYLTTSDGTKYEITGKDFHKFVDKKVVITGTLGPGIIQGESAIAVSQISINGAAGIFATTAGKVWFVAGTAAVGTGVGVGVYELTNSSP